MNFASIDIGSNTVILLICAYENGKLITLENHYSMPRISKGLNQNKNISDEKIVDLFDIITKYMTVIKKYNCEKVFIIGTAALRKAANANKINDEFEKKFNYKINIIPGEQEAKYSYLGALLASNSNLDKMVIDIGGGSTEIIIGNSEGINYAKSVQYGAVNLTEMYFPNLPLNEDLFENVKNEIYNQFNEFQIDISKRELIAVAGTPTTLYCMLNGIKDYSDLIVNKKKISIIELENLIEKLKFLTSNQILENYGSVVTGRNDIITAGTIILASIMKKFVIENLTVSTTGIRYGIILEYLYSIGLEVLEHVYQNQE